jgi:hypothetical protein
MRKEKSGHARGTDYCGRAGARGRSRHDGMRRDGGAAGKGKGTGGSAEKEDCAMSGWWKIGGVASGARAAEKVLKKIKQVIGNAI